MNDAWPCRHYSTGPPALERCGRRLDPLDELPGLPGLAELPGLDELAWLDEVLPAAGLSSYEVSAPRAPSVAPPDRTL
jgi:hypothetical protein